MSSYDTSLMTKVVNLNDGSKWVQYSEKNRAARKYGLMDAVKEYKPNGEIDKITLRFSEQPLFGYTSVEGTKEQISKIMKGVAKLPDKASVINFLKVLEILNKR